MEGQTAPGSLILLYT